MRGPGHVWRSPSHKGAPYHARRGGKAPCPPKTHTHTEAAKHHAHVPGVASPCCYTCSARLDMPPVTLHHTLRLWTHNLCASPSRRESRAPEPVLKITSFHLGQTGTRRPSALLPASRHHAPSHAVAQAAQTYTTATLHPTLHPHAGGPRRRGDQRGPGCCDTSLAHPLGESRNTMLHYLRSHRSAPLTW